MTIRIFTLVAGLLIASECRAESGAMAEKVRSMLIGRTITSSSTTPIQNGAMEVSGSMTMTYSNFLIGNEGNFSYDVTTQSDLEYFDIDKQGNKTKKNEKRSVGVIHYDFWVSNSTGKYIGSTKVLSSIKFPSRRTTFVRLSIDGEKLVIQEDLVGYSDHYATGGKYKPGTQSSDETFDLTSGKLRMSQHTVGYEVDPDTLVRGKCTADFADTYTETAPSE